MTAVSKAMYKPLALAASVGGGIVAGAVFGQLWKRVAGESEAQRIQPSDRPPWSAHT